MSQPKVRPPSSKRLLIKKMFFNGGNVTICLLSYSLRSKSARWPLIGRLTPSLHRFLRSTHFARRSKERDFVVLSDARYMPLTLLTFSPFMDSFITPHHRIFLCLITIIPCLPVLIITIVLCVTFLHHVRHCVNYNCVFSFICDLKRTLSPFPLRTLATATRNHQIF